VLFPELGVVQCLAHRLANELACHLSLGTLSWEHCLLTILRHVLPLGWWEQSLELVSLIFVQDRSGLSCHLLSVLLEDRLLLICFKDGLAEWRRSTHGHLFWV